MNTQTKNIRRYWLENRILHDYFTSCMNELPSHYLEYFFTTYIKKKIRVLSIGCGQGQLERHLIMYPQVVCIDGFDINQENIAIAKKQSNSDRINYHVADGETIQLKEQRYDLIIAHHSLHHIADLTHLFSQISLSLKKNGFFVFVEYVGPNRFRWTDQQLYYINSLLSILPKKYRILSPETPDTRDIFSQKTLELYLESEPSEAINSENIVRIASSFFDTVEIRPMGGTIMHLLFSDIINNFSDDDEYCGALLKQTCFFEKTLIQKSILPSDFMFFIGKKLHKAIQ